MQCIKTHQCRSIELAAKLLQPTKVEDQQKSINMETPKPLK